MEWLRRLSQSFLDTQYWGKKFRKDNPGYQPQFEVYQSADFPHVFLGGEDDFEEAQARAGQPFCKIVDCRDLPEINESSWDYATFTTVQKNFDSKVNDLVQKISTTDCPIFVHCALGANRSVAVLAAALAQLTGKPLNSILSEMKQVRSYVNPQDPYYLMALQQSPSETPQFKQERFDELDQDFPLIQPGLPTNTAQIPENFPDDLLGDMDLLHQEKQWRQVVSTPGSLVRHDDYGWTGKVIELRGNPVNGGVVLVEYPLSAEEAERLGTNEGHVVQRFHGALSLSPVMQLASPFRRASSWLQRVSSLSNDNSFFLLNGDVVFFSCLHQQYLTRTFGVSMTEGDAFRFLLPRGRATSGYYGVLIEASAELQPYQKEIIYQLGLGPTDRTKWEFNDNHYQVNSDLAWEQLPGRGQERYSFSSAAERFLSRYFPSLLESQI